MTVSIRSISSTHGADAAEWKARVELATAFRLANRLGWNEGIANHFSMIVRVERSMTARENFPGTWEPT